MATNLLFPSAASGPDPKLHVTHGYLPRFIDPSQPPTKRSPVPQLKEINFIHFATLILPTTLYHRCWSNVASRLVAPQYAKVILNLTDVLTGDFFNDYIKTGNILLLSEGTPGVSTTFSLLHGVLRLDMSREIYERCGLQGKPVLNSGDRKHTKEHFCVEIDLRSPSMVSGKKGFERLKYAAREVLNESKVCLFRDVSLPSRGKAQEQKEEWEKTATRRTDVLKQHYATVVEASPTINNMKLIPVPAMIRRGPPENFQSYSNINSKGPLRPPVEQLDDYYDITEYLDLLSLASPRVQPVSGQNPEPDPYISRYTIPTDSTEDAAVQDLTVLRWTGFLDSTWATTLFIEIARLSRQKDKISSRLRAEPELPADVEGQQMQHEKDADQHWFSFSVTAHHTHARGQTDGCTVLVHSHEALLTDSASRAADSTKDSGMDVDFGLTTDAATQKDPDDAGDVGDAMQVDVPDTDADPTLRLNAHRDADTDTDTNTHANATATATATEKEKEKEKDIRTDTSQRFTCFKFVDA